MGSLLISRRGATKYVAWRVRLQRHCLLIQLLWEFFGIPPCVLQWACLSTPVILPLRVILQPSCLLTGVCVDAGGCITGEHGVGIEKRDHMPLMFSPEDLEAQMRVKDVFDPGWLLNPAKVFPLASSEARRAQTGEAA